MTEDMISKMVLELTGAHLGVSLAMREMNRS